MDYELLIGEHCLELLTQEWNKIWANWPQFEEENKMKYFKCNNCGQVFQIGDEQWRKFYYTQPTPLTQLDQIVKCCNKPDVFEIGHPKTINLEKEPKPPTAITELKAIVIQLGKIINKLEDC